MPESPPLPTCRHEPASPATVLVASEGDDASLWAATLAARLFPASSRWEIVCVIPPRLDPTSGETGFASPVMTPDEVEQRNAADRIEADAAIAETARAIGPVPVHSRVRRGRPAEEILEHAQEAGADVVVVGVRPGEFDLSLSASVADRIADNPDHPVLVVPAEATRPRSA